MASLSGPRANQSTLRKKNVSGNWETGKSDVARDWGRRENSAPSVNLVTEQAWSKIDIANGQVAGCSAKGGTPLYLWENKLLSTKPYQDKQRDNSTYLIRIPKKLQFKD